MSGFVEAVKRAISLHDADNWAWHYFQGPDGDAAEERRANYSLSHAQLMGPEFVELCGVTLQTKKIIPRIHWLDLSGL